MQVLEVSSHRGISLKNILFATDFSEASGAAVFLRRRHLPPIREPIACDSYGVASQLHSSYRT